MMNAFDHWREAHPHLARQCQRSAVILGGLQNELLEQMADAVCTEGFGESSFELEEFLDKYGRRAQELSIILSVFNQFGGTT